MITATLIVFGIIVLGGAVGGAAWFIARARRSVPEKNTARETVTAKGTPFRWKYVVLPLVFFFLSITLAAYFYHQLPAQVATRFTFDGTPDGWLSREITMVLMLAPQLLLTLMAVAVTWGITKLGFLFKPPEGIRLRPERILLFMGNVIALPQLILCFAMLDIFSYNSYQRHFVPMPIFLLVILGLATIALGMLLVLIIQQSKRQLTTQSGQSSKE